MAQSSGMHPSHVSGNTFQACILWLSIHPSHTRCGTWYFTRFHMLGRFDIEKFSKSILCLFSIAKKKMKISITVRHQYACSVADQRLSSREGYILVLVSNKCTGCCKCLRVRNLDFPHFRILMATKSDLHSNQATNGAWWRQWKQ